MSTLLLLILLLALTAAVRPQPSQNQGIDLYSAGKYSEARKVFSQAVKNPGSPDDPDLWNYLGLAYLGEKDYKNARKSFEKAVALNPTKAFFHTNLAFVNLVLRQYGRARSGAQKALAIEPQNLNAWIIHGTTSLWERKLDDAERDADQAIAANPRRADGYILKSEVLINRFSTKLENSSPKKQLPILERAADVLKEGAEKCGSSCKELREQYEGLVVFRDYFSDRKSDDALSAVAGPPPPEPGVTPIKILNKPRPSYTNAARQNNTEGSIILAVLFAANGTIQHVLLLKRLGDGLDEQAIKAARAIKFEPMQKDGKPVPVVKRVEYTFEIY